MNTSECYHRKMQRTEFKLKKKRKRKEEGKRKKTTRRANDKNNVIYRQR